MDPKSSRPTADDGLAALFRGQTNGPTEPDTIEEPRPVPDFLPSMVIADGQFLAVVLQSREDQVSRKELVEWTYIYRRYQVITQQPAMIIHRLYSRLHYVLPASSWKKADKTQFELISMMETQDMTQPAQPAARIPRPRNQFMLYRQWISDKLRAENDGMTAGTISQVVANMWRSEKRHVKDHFKRLSIEEERRHAAKYPGYRYDGGKDKVPHYPYHLQDVQHDPMTTASRLINAGF
ncbi:hypothetical protein QBC47DRAFT_458527 [Echria macrotheca]|uniref:HMG box domain-containing protein n=1 Tax=Echria macrotheca TaxID=438768 RepID=A0AAJ0BHJ4_9PEZI|nr:hypothetical protein QBC47DRAFT_458527 [Echria macrotheca]